MHQLLEPHDTLSGKMAHRDIILILEWNTKKT